MLFNSSTPFFSALCALVLSLVSVNTHAQTKFQTRFEMIGIAYEQRLVMVDPGPGWKGYSLPDDAKALGLTAVNGIALFRNRLFAGVGLGYLRFSGINGASTFAEVEYTPFTGRISPLLSVRTGYNHVWSQYKNGTGSTLLDFGAGLNVKLGKRNALYARSGVLIMQQISFIPLSLGLKLDW